MLQVGFGTADITPPKGMPIPGGFRPVASEGVRDPLSADACVLGDGATTIALIGIDALAIAGPTVAAARKRIAAEAGIPAEHVLIGCSHTHSGGPSRLVGEGDAPQQAYQKILIDGIVAAAVQASRSLHAAELGVGTGLEGTIAFNRRFLMKDGREITHPGKPGTPHHAQIVRPAGPVDTEVGVLAARAPGGALLGMVVTYACHSTVVGGNQFSADYPGQFRKHLRTGRDPHFPVVFLLGACGDVTQVNNLAPGTDFGPELADLMGRKLAAEALRVLRGITFSGEGGLAAATESLTLALRPEGDPDRDRPAFGLGSGADVDVIYAESRRQLAEQRAKDPNVKTEVQALRIGPLAIVTNASEYFAEDGIALKAASPLRPTWVVTLANDWIGYVPHARALLAGGYESRHGRASRLAIESAQLVAEASLRALNRIAGTGPAT